MLLKICYRISFWAVSVQFWSSCTDFIRSVLILSFCLLLPSTQFCHQNSQLVSFFIQATCSAHHDILDLSFGTFPINYLPKLNYGFLVDFGFVTYNVLGFITSPSVFLLPGLWKKIHSILRFIFSLINLSSIYTSTWLWPNISNLSWFFKTFLMKYSGT